VGGVIEGAEATLARLVGGPTRPGGSPTASLGETDTEGTAP